MIQIEYFDKHHIIFLILHWIDQITVVKMYTDNVRYCCSYDTHNTQHRYNVVYSACMIIQICSFYAILSYIFDYDTTRFSVACDFNTIT